MTDGGKEEKKERIRRGRSEQNKAGMGGEKREREEEGRGDGESSVDTVEGE